MRAAIVGGGIAGLAAALALAREGAQVVLFERAPVPSPIGSGLLLQPPGLAVLRDFGLDGLALARGARITALDGRTKRGRTVLALAYSDWEAGAFGLGMHRGTLWRMLLEAGAAAGVEMRAGVDIQPGDPRLEGFDLHVHAGGSRSALRACLACGDGTRPYAWGAWYATVPAPPGWDVTRLAQRFEGTTRMMGILPIGRDPDGDAPWLAMFWSERLDRMQAVRDAGWSAWTREVVSLWPEAADVVAPLRGFDDLLVAAYADVRVRRWSSDRGVIVGDMAHGTSPQLGQGATLALLDARALAECLRSLPVGEALRAFARGRRAHVAYYQWASRVLTPLFQSDGVMLGRLRDGLMAPISRLPGVHREFLATLTGHKAGVLFGRLRT